MAMYSVYIEEGNQYSGVKAVDYDVRLDRVDVRNDYGTSPVTVELYIGSSVSLSGGSSKTPFPFIDGAPAATATFRAGVSKTGTWNLFALLSLPQQGTGSFSLPGDLIVGPGDGFLVNLKVNSGGDSTAQCAFYFEEMRLALPV